MSTLSIKRYPSWMMLFAALAGYLLLNSAQSAPMRFDYGSGNGQIQSVYIAESNLVFKVSATGRLDGIWQLSSHSQAQRFLDQSRLRYFHSTRLPFAANEGTSPNSTRLYTRREVNRQNLSYYRTAYDKQHGFYDAVKSVNGTQIDYYRNTVNNKRYGLVGKVKRIGSVNISYHFGTGRDRGKVKYVGRTQFSYEPYSSTGKAAGYIGKFMRIGGVPIKYFAAYSSHKGYQGKVRSIGNVNIKYLNKFNIPHPPANRFGQFDKTTGSDKRFSLFVR